MGIRASGPPEHEPDDILQCVELICQCPDFPARKVAQETSPENSGFLPVLPPDLWDSLFHSYLPPRTLKILSCVSRDLWVQVWSPIKSIRFSGDITPLSLTRDLLRVPQIDKINQSGLRDSCPADYTLATIACGSLRPTQLNLSRCAIQSSSLRFLADLDLTHLDLDCCCFSGPPPDLAHLKGLTSLRVLKLRAVVIAESLSGLSGLTNLLELNLSCTGLSDSHLMHLRPLTKLQFLDVSYNPQLKNVETLQTLQNLQQLLVVGCPCLLGDGLSHWGHLFPQLKTLSVYTSRLSMAAISALLSMPGIQSLDLSVSGITLPRQAWEIVGDLSQLRTLNLKRTLIGHQGLKCLERLTSLEHLNLSIGRCSRAKDIYNGLSFITNLVKLVSLDLSGHDLAYLGRFLSRLTQLEILVVAKTDVTSNQISGIQSLTSLDLSDCTTFHAADLCHVGISSLTNLTDLSSSLYGKDVGACAKFTNLTSLVLHSGDINAHLPVTVLDGFRFLTKLKNFDIDTLPHDAFPALRRCCALENLKLRGITFDKKEGLEPLFHMPNLSTLYLRRCTLNPLCMEHLESMPNLSRVIFYDCRDVSDEQVEELKRRIYHNLEIQNISLRCENVYLTRIRC